MLLGPHQQNNFTSATAKLAPTCGVGAAAAWLAHADTEPRTYVANCRRESILDIARSRTGWLVAFCIGLLLAAVVVEQFEDVLEHHVELSFFVPVRDLNSKAPDT